MRSKKDDVRETYTTIYHDIRIKMGLNLLDYVLLDTVRILSQNDKGYCYKSIRALGKDLDVSVGGIHKSLMRLVKGKHLTKVEGGYKACENFIKAVDAKRSLSEQAVRSKRSLSEQGVRKVNGSVHFVQEKQILDIQEINNRNTYGSPREDTREPREKKPPTETALRLQGIIKRIQSGDK